MTNSARVPSAEAFPSARRANLTLALLLIAYIFSFLDRQILSLMVAPIRATLGINDFQVSLLQGLAFALFFVTAGLVLGRLADRFRRTWIIAAGIFLWSMMTIACGFASSFSMLFLARVGLGVGEAALAPAGFSLLADSFPPGRLVRATSIFSAGALLGGGLAFFVGGALIDYLGQMPPPLIIGNLQPWQIAFVVVAIPSLLLVPILLLIPEPARGGGTQAPVKLADLITYFWNRRADFAPFYLCTGLLSILNYGGLSWFPTHLIRTFDLSPGRTGVLLGAIQLVGSLIGAVGGAALTEYFQRRGRKDAHLRTVVVVALAAAVGFTAPFMPTLETTLIVWSFAIVTLGAYFGSIIAALQLMTPNNMRGANSALVLMFSTLIGLAVGTSLIGGLADIAFAGRPSGIGYSLACLGIPLALVTAVVAARGLPNFARVVQELV
ncbi:MAG: transporter [Sphingomonadales bacterium]|nr:transporter [Sphingomonadales bacterium]